MVFITIVTGAYKPTYILGASHCIYMRVCRACRAAKSGDTKDGVKAPNVIHVQRKKKNYNDKTPDGETHDSHANFTGA